MRYRGFNLIEALREVGVEATHFDEPQIPNRIREILGYDLIVLVRRPFSETMRELVAAADQYQIPVALDLDDYIFEEDAIPFISLFQNLPAEVGRNWVSPYRQMLLAAGYFTTVTRKLVERAGALGRPGLIIRNGFNRAQMVLSEQAVDRRRKDSRVRLGYFSGTRTHQADFRVISPVLLRLMTEYPQVDLLVAGDFDLAEFSEFNRFDCRVHSRPFVSWTELPAEIAAADVNLVPLERNPFTESKSNLKYYEAALVRVPTVATPTGPFAGCITHGENGFLADSQDDWHNALRQLIESPDLRRQLGEQAFQRAIQEYGPEAVAADALSTYRQIIRTHRTMLGVSADTITVFVVLSDLDRAVQDFAPALVLAAELSLQGVAVTLLLQDGGLTAPEAERLLASWLAETKLAVQVGGEVPCADLLVAGDPAAAYRVAEAACRGRSAVYIPSDYDPVRVPPGELRDYAARSFDLGLPIYTHDPIAAALIRRRHPVAEVRVLPVWRTEKFVTRHRLDVPTELVISTTGTLSQADRAEIVKAIRRIHATHSDLSIVCAGSGGILADGSGVPHRIVTRSDQLSRLSSESDDRSIYLVICAVITPSWVANLMAQGCPVVVAVSDPDLVTSSEAEIPTIPIIEQRLVAVLESLLNDRVWHSAMALRQSSYAARIAEPAVAARQLLTALDPADDPHDVLVIRRIA